MSEGFFSRWSRRKQEVAGSQGAQPKVPAAAVAEPVPAKQALPPEPMPDSALDPVPVQTPTLDDVQTLTSDSDFQPFMQRGVAPDVRNAAMKKLFADPHFNVMDGLDIYIDDYSQPDPMPAGMLQRMASAQFLGLVPPEATEASRAAETPVTLQAPAKWAHTEAGTQVVAQSPEASALAPPTTHDHPDLQLQPDPAPADPQPGPSAR